MLFKHHVQNLACHGISHKHRDTGSGAKGSTESVHASSNRVLRLAKTPFRGKLDKLLMLAGSHLHRLQLRSDADIRCSPPCTAISLPSRLGKT